ncbi:MAG: hypothetical protein M1839_008201 [Geoglossum umbratile]|nr:MAG: hypothetical protein M1839_008201 [Geoglossum umbratile]
MDDDAVHTLVKQCRNRCYGRGRGRGGQKRQRSGRDAGTAAGGTVTDGPSQDNIAAAVSTETAAPVGTTALVRTGTSPRNTRQAAKKGKKFSPLQLGPAQASANPGLKTYVQQAKGVPLGGPFAATARLGMPTQLLPEKEFSGEHFPALSATALIVRPKGTLPKPSDWAPAGDPKRDEAEEITLRMVEEQRSLEEGRLLWLRDPMNPINGCYEVPSAAATPIDGFWGGPHSRTWKATQTPDSSRTKMLRAPYVFSEKWEFGKPLADQKSTLFSLSTELLSAIFCQLDHRSRIKFMRTSRTSSELMSRMMTVWDLSSGDFCDAEKGLMGNCGPTATTVVTEFSGSCAKDVVRHEVNVLKTMALSFSLWTRVFRVVEFHRAHLVSMDLLRHIIPALPNVEYLGIFECNLMHVGEAIPLLETIRKNVRLDFFPRRPICYDVSIASRVALPAMLFHVLPPAKKKNSQLIDRGSAFESYLKLELPGIPTKQFEKISDGIQDEQLTGLISACKDRLPYPCPVDPNSKNGRLWECENCELELKGCFFAKAQLKDPDRAVCWGCKLRQALDEEKHNKRVDGHRYAELYHWYGNCGTLEDVVGAIKNQCKEQDEKIAFTDYHANDDRVKMARNKFCNPRFHVQAMAARERGEDSNGWWPEEKAASGQYGRRAPRRRGVGKGSRRW